MSHKNISDREARFEDPLETFVWRLDNLTELKDLIINNISNPVFLNLLNKNTFQEDMLTEVKSIYVIGLVSALELHFKDLFADLIDGKYYDYSKLDIKLELEDLKRILDKKITAGTLISSKFNFQNLNGIQKAFSKLISHEFFHEIEIFKDSIDYEKFQLSNKLPDDYFEVIEALIQLRHKYVHNMSLYEELETTMLQKYKDYTYWLVLTCNAYFEFHVDFNSSKVRSIVYREYFNENEEEE